MKEYSDSPAKKKKLHFSLIIFLVCLMFTVLLWDHYLRQGDDMDRTVISNLLLLMGSLFSIAAGLLTLSLETAESVLQKEVEKRTAELQKRNGDLEQAIRQIKVLQGFLPICASCKKIRDDEGYWQELETYVEKHSEAEFSHGLCQGCIKKLYPGYHPAG
jgi:hypothetical protein